MKKPDRPLTKLELSRYAGFVPTNITIDENQSVHILLQRLEDKMNEIIEQLNQNG